MIPKEHFFNGELWVENQHHKTLTVKIREAWKDGSDYGNLRRRGFGISKQALEFAMWNGLQINILNEGEKFRIHPQKVKQIVYDREKEGAKALFETNGVTIYMVRAGDCEALGYYDKYSETT